MLVRQHIIMKRSKQDDGKKAAAQRQGGEGLDEEERGRNAGTDEGSGGPSCCKFVCESHQSGASSPALQRAKCDAAALRGRAACGIRAPMRDSSSSSSDESSSSDDGESHTPIQAAINHFLTPGLSPKGRTDVALGKALKLLMSKEMLENENVMEIMCKHPDFIRLVFNEDRFDEEWLQKFIKEAWHVVRDVRISEEEELEAKISEVWLAEGEAQDTVQGLEKACLDYREGVAKVLENVVACLGKRQKESPFLWSRLSTTKEQPKEYWIPIQEIAR